MQYLLSVIDDQTGSATSEEMAAIDLFNARLIADGHWVLAAGLQTPADATVVDNRSGEADVRGRPVRGDQGVRRRVLDHRSP